MNRMTLEEFRTSRNAGTVHAARAYESFCVGTAKYPTEIAALAGNVSAGLLYTAIGFGDETGEFAEYFDATRFSEASRAECYAKAWPELGDVQWYLARICAEVPELPSFESMVAGAMEAVSVPNSNRLSGYDLQSILCVQAGRVLGVVKKMMRDGSSWTPEKRAEKIDALRMAVSHAIYASVDFAERTGPLVGFEGGYVNLLRGNSDKLQDRKDRGVLQGDGDKR